MASFLKLGKSTTKVLTISNLPLMIKTPIQTQFVWAFLNLFTNDLYKITVNP